MLEVIINKIRKLTSEILKHELEQDLNVCTTLEFKLIQLRNSIESYINMKIKPRKSSSSRSHNVTPRAKSPPISEPLHHSVTKMCKAASHADSQKGSDSSFSSKKSSKSSLKSSLTKSSKESLNMSDKAPPSNTYLSLERRKTAQFDQLLAEQSKERVQRKLLILEKSFELQNEQLLEEAFEAESKVQLTTLERKGKPSFNRNESISVLAHSLPEIVPKDSFDIYQNTKKNLINEKPDNVTLSESQSQEKTQIHRKLRISEIPTFQSNLNTDNKVGLNHCPRTRTKSNFPLKAPKATQKLRNLVQ